MCGILHFETFLLAGILLNLTPGNDTIYILSRSMAQGRRAGFLSALGIATGSLIHTALAAFGLSLIIAKSIFIFTTIKYAGAVYLVYLGYKMLTDKTNFASPLPEVSPVKHFRIYREAVLTNLLNPKVAMFFIAFLPQFIDPSYKHSFIPFLLLGFTFTLTGTLWCCIIANFSAALSYKFRSNQRLASWLNKTCGVVLIALGVKVALTGRR